MVLNYIWIFFFLGGFLIALLKMFAGDTSVFPAMVESLFKMAELGASISLGYIGLMALWLGLMKIGEAGGAIAVLSKLVAPFFRRLFPEIPAGHSSVGSIMMNFSANMLGLDNAATPLGLKAMGQLQEINPKKEEASNAQIMFLVLNTSGLTLIPISVITLRAIQGAVNPTDIFLPIMIATYCSTLAGLLLVGFIQKLKLWDPVVIAYLAGTGLLIYGLFWYFGSLDKEALQSQSALLSSLVIMGLITWFLTMAFCKGINVYEHFIEGAKEGFGVAVKIIPYLVAMLAAVGVFRASGGLDILTSGIGRLVGLMGIDTSFVDALPTAMMKPLSGSGARGLAVEAMESYGADSFIGRLACTFQGSTETTFYTLALYFGAIGVRRTRYTLGCGLFADLVGAVAAIFVAYRFFS